MAGGGNLSDAAGCVRRLAALAGVSASEGRDFRWAAIERDLGLRLPADYKQLAGSFPDGYFRRFVHVRWPERWPDGQVRLLSEFSSGQLESMREYRDAGCWDTGEVEFPYPLFPEPGGILPWGGIASPGVAFWLTGPGDPGGWPVVVATEECDYWDRFDGTACDFLIAVATARYDASRFMTAAFDEQDLRKPARPLELSEQPVFEQSGPPPVPAGSPGEPPAGV
jgi:hypothetical protein